MTHDELAERIEALEGPCREMDAEIAVSVLGMERDGDYFFGKDARDEDFVLERDYYSLDGTARELPHYTTSLDAAMTLADGGFGSLIRWRYAKNGRAGYCAVVTKPSRAEAGAATPALALCAAALRARST